MLFSKNYSLFRYFHPNSKGMHQPNIKLLYLYKKNDRIVYILKIIKIE
jgi:hypothetical protein